MASKDNQHQSCKDEHHAGINDTNKSTDVDQPSSSSSTAVSTPLSVSNVKTASVTNERQLANLMRSFGMQQQNKTEVKHLFWDTQPVPKLGEDSLTKTKVGPMDDTKTVADVRPEPYLLPVPFYWVTCNIHDESQLEEVYSLLVENYVEDDDNMFRFNYSKEFLRWALTPPGFVQDWHVGVRTDKGKLVAFITGVPAELSVLENRVKLAEVNFLCIHKKLRSKRLAPVLIKEVTRRVNMKGIWQAVYTAGSLLTKPIAQCTYYHRSLNIKKLLDVKFTGLTGKMTLSMAQKLYRLPDEPQITGLRPMRRKDIRTVLELLTNDLKHHTIIYPIFTQEEAEHILLPRDNVIVSYVREIDGNVTDFLSFYILPSSVIAHEKHSTLNAAYCFYYVAQSVSIADLMKDALTIAKNQGMDVFNALDLARNEDFIKELKFGKGDGSLRYYLYNYLCPDMEPNNIGLVML